MALGYGSLLLCTSMECCSRLSHNAFFGNLLPVWTSSRYDQGSCQAVLRRLRIATGAIVDMSDCWQGGVWRTTSGQKAFRTCGHFYASKAIRPRGRNFEGTSDTGLIRQSTMGWDCSENQASTTIWEDGQRDTLDVLEATEVTPLSTWTMALSRDRISMDDLTGPVADDLHILNENLNTVVGAENPLLMAVAGQIFSAGGKRMRPALVLLVSRATAQLAGLENLMPQHRRLAEIIEMIHTASLIHDDVLDESFIRRGKETVHQLYGTRIAVLAGDFLFAQTSWFLANLENIDVIKLISQVIKDFASGEIKQATSLFDCDVSLQDYLDKCYYKTASLIAASTCSAAIFSGVSIGVQSQMFNYGKNLGLAFQVVDDILDFTQSTENLGKPAGSDLVKGNLTAPVIFALEQEPTLKEIIESEFTDEESLAAAIELVHKSGGIEKAHVLAKQKGDVARECLGSLPQGSIRTSLEGMVDYVLERLY